MATRSSRPDATSATTGAPDGGKARRRPALQVVPIPPDVAAAIDLLRRHLLPKGPQGKSMSRGAGNRISGLALRLAGELATAQSITEYPSAQAIELADLSVAQLPIVEALEQIAAQTRTNLRARRAALEPSTFALYSALQQLVRFSPDPTLRRSIDELKGEIRVGGRKKKQ